MWNLWRNDKGISVPPTATVHIYQSEYDFILSEVRKFPSIETGGDLFGTFTHADMPIIWLALGPGPKAIHDRAEFCQDTDYTTRCQKYLMQRFGLQYIGSWHSHHRLGLKEPSSGDVRAAQIYATRHNRERTLEIITTFNDISTVIIPYFYPNAKEEGWVASEFRILSGDNPIRPKLTFARHVGKEYLEVDSIGERTIDTQQTDIQIANQTPQSEIRRVGNISLDRELEELDLADVNVEMKRENIYLVTISLANQEIIAIAVDSSKSNELKLLQINYINFSNNLNIDITKDIEITALTKMANKGNLLKYLYEYAKEQDYYKWAYGRKHSKYD